MRRFFLMLTLSLLVSSAGQIYAQEEYPINPPGYHIKINGDGVNLSGQLREFTDSTISIYNISNQNHYKIDFENINMIKIRKSFPAIAARDLATGAAVGGILAFLYILNDLKSDDPSHPPFLSTMATGIFIGTGLGLVFGVGEGMISLRIPINKNRYISGRDKSRLQKYLSVAN